MESIYLCIVIFLLCLAVFDLFVGVSNDAVNFLQSAIGAKVAKFRTVLIIASVGVVLGAVMSSGMMDVARHGIMNPARYNFYEVMTIFLAVMVTDVIVLDVFNTLGSDALDSPGFDLLALFTGSEGMLGVTTEVTVKLLPKPPVARVLLASFDSVEKAGLAVGDIIANGIIPGGLEMMDNLSIRAAEDFIHAGYPVDAEAILLCELDGVESDVQEDCERVNDILLKAGATDVRLAQDEAERVRFWAGRKNAFPAVGRISPDYYCMDGTIPRRALPGVLEGIARLSQQYDLRVANVFHAGDGIMHPLILFDANEPGEFARAEELGGKILELCVEVGGSISGEHGIGREKINQMCAQFNSDEITTFHAVKAAFDPDGLLNPGKNIPTLHRCAEFGAMHVHHGHLPFPELERF